MGLFTNLFSSRVPEQPSSMEKAVFFMGMGNFELEIVGAQHHQTALEAICGPRMHEEIKRFETALLILDNKNRHDKNLVRVEIRKKLVGYLNREAAIQYRLRLKETGTPTAHGQCQAIIRGGWVSFDGRKGDYRVWLDLSIPSH